MPEKKDRQAKDGAAPTAAPASYEAALAELELLVARMEGGALSLEESLSSYRRGAVLVSYCQQQLEKVDQQVRVLDGETLKDADLDTRASREAGGKAGDDGEQPDDES